MRITVHIDSFRVEGQSSSPPHPGIVSIEEQEPETDQIAKLSG